MDYVRVTPTPATSTRDARVFVITADLADPSYQAYLLLRNGLTIALILAGADKFLNAMIDWVQYLAPIIPRTFSIPPEILLRGSASWKSRSACGSRSCHSARPTGSPPGLGWSS